MTKYSKTRTLLARAKYAVFEKEFSGPRLGLLALMLIPMVAYPMTLSDYENTATVSASADQFENDTSNNSNTVKITPNAEIVIVKQVVNDDGGVLSLADFNVVSSAGTLVFDSGTTAGDITTFTAEKLYVPPGTYTLGEADVDGYQEGLWSCSNGVLTKNAFDEGEITLEFGESTVCTIENNDIAPTLTLTKKSLRGAQGLGSAPEGLSMPSGQRPLGS